MIFFIFIVAAIVAVIGLVVFVGGLIVKEGGAAVVGAIVFVVAGLLVLGTCITTIGTKDVGVVTAFGRPTGRDLENGLHKKAPWQKITEMDGAIQPDEYKVPVRIGDSTTADVQAVIRWRIVPDQASVLYQDYRSDDVNKTIRDSLVRTQFQAALNDVLGKYNPLTAVAQQAQNAAGTGQAPSSTTAANLDEFSAAVKSSMDAHLKAAAKGTKSEGAEQVKVISVTIQFLHLAKTTQDKINDLQKEVGATRIAEQRELTAEAQARANQNLSKSVSHDPNVLVSKCFDSVEDAIKANYPLPAGFSCWSGGGGSVVIPGTR